MSGWMNWVWMNGYGAYIWPAYGLVLGVLALNLVLIKRQRIVTFKILKKWFKIRHKNDACS